MKKNLLRLTTAGLFIWALLFTISVPPGGGISLIKKAHAVENTYQAYYASCGDGDLIIIVCGAGGNGCTPVGVCP